MRLAFLNWRDSTHPEGGGAELYAETICAGLGHRGHDVTLYCASHEGAPPFEQRDGYRVSRQGGRLGVYASTLSALRRDALGGGFDAVIDTQNGIPFFSPVATAAPVISLVHHVHREQWPVVFGPVQSRVGWWVESSVAPRVYRGRQYVAVSERTKDELVDLGVRRDDIAVIHNGTAPAVRVDGERSADPTIVVLGRLVPHKRVEHAIDVVARLAAAHPRLRLRVIGQGWWSERIAEHAQQLGVADRVDLLGFVSDATKHLELQRSWLALAPSLKEGWGLSVVEAASHGVPTVAYHGAGGLSESIVDGVSGVLVHDLDAMTATVDRLLTDATALRCLGEGALAHSARFTWDTSVVLWEELLERAVMGARPSTLSDTRLSRVRWPVRRARR